MAPSGATDAVAVHGATESHVRVTSMACSACTDVVEAAVSAHRRVWRVAVWLLQNHATSCLTPQLYNKKTNVLSGKIPIISTAMAKVLISAPLLLWCGVCRRVSQSLRARNHWVDASLVQLRGKLGALLQACVVVFSYFNCLHFFGYFVRVLSHFSHGVHYSCGKL